MFCPNCGNKLEDDAIFCPFCGTRVAEDTGDTQMNAYYSGTGSIGSSPYRTNHGQAAQAGGYRTKRRKGNRRSGKNGKGLLVAGVIAAIVLAGAGISALAGAQIVNGVRLLTMKPEKYYQAVEKDYVEDLLKTAEVIYADYALDGLSIYDKTYHVELSGTTTDKLQNVAGSVTEGEDVSWVKSFNVDAEVTSLDNVLQAKADLEINDKAIADALVFADLDAQEIYGTIPVLAEEYVRYTYYNPSNNRDLTQVARDLLEGDDSYMGIPNMDDVQSYLELFPKKKQVDDMANRYLDLILTNLDQVKKLDKKQTIAVENVSHAYTALDVTVTCQTMVNISSALNREVHTDKELQNILLDVTGNNHIYEVLCEEAEYNADSMERTLQRVGPDEIGMIMRLYVDSKGQICGRELYGGNEPMDEPLYVLYYIEDKGNCALECTVPGGGVATAYGDVNGETVSEAPKTQRPGIVAVGTRHGNKADLEVTWRDVFASKKLCTLTNWDTKSWKKGEFSGTIAPIYSYDAESDSYGMLGYMNLFDGISGNIDFDISSRQIKLDITPAYNGNELGNTVLKITKSGGKKAKLDRKAEVVDITGYSDWRNFYYNVDTTDLFKRMIDAGATGTLANKSVYDFIVNMAFGQY